jgi:hypothetical protein
MIYGSETRLAEQRYRRTNPPDSDPGFGGFDLGPILGQVIVAAACGAGLTVIVAIVRTRRTRRR